MAMGENAWKYYLFLFGVLSGVSCISLSIYPRTQVVRTGDNLHVTCRAPPGLSLNSCKFFITGMPGIDFSLGRDSEATDDYRYYGRGLERGYCGISLFQIAHDCSDMSKMITITCAAQIQDYGWAVNYMPVLISNVRTFPLTMERQRVVVQPGSNVSVLCSSAGVAIKSCLFQGKHLGSVDLSQGRARPPVVVGGSSEMQGRVHYFGQGLAEGECGVTLTDVRDDWSGLLWCAAKSEFDNWGYDYTTFIVAKSPSTPTLKLSSSDLKLGESLNATCTVRSFRPAVNISWEPPFDEAVRDVYSGDLFDTRLDFEEQVVSQNTVKRVTETDHLRTVCCTAKYDDNKHEVVARQQVKVRFCGRRNFKGAKPLVFGGVVAKSGEFPWHVALYLKRNNTHDYICGGSLISTKHFITAAHCVWNKDFSRPGAATAYAAALGKFHIAWDEDEHAQKFDILAVEVHKRYADFVRSYEDDIAILKLAGEAVFSRQTHPICLDWSLAIEDSLLVNGNLGVVPGWGLTEHGNLSDTLRYTELPYMDLTECTRIVPVEFQRYLAPAKYCGGYVNQSVAVCGGDSGGGMAFYQNMTLQYYLMGLVSLAPKPKATNCNSENVAAFTQISDYLPWIKSVLDKDDVTHARQSMV